MEKDLNGNSITDTTIKEVCIHQVKSQAVNGDVLMTQAGNDIITINDNTFTQVNAGAGIDRLVLEGDAIHLDFSNIQDIDIVDMNDAATTANTLTLSLADVLTTTDNSTLSVLGDAADTVNLAIADNWAAPGVQVVDGVTFDAYDSAGAILLIEQGISVHLV